VQASGVDLPGVWGHADRTRAHHPGPNVSSSPSTTPELAAASRPERRLQLGALADLRHGDLVEVVSACAFEPVSRAEARWCK